MPRLSLLDAKMRPSPFSHGDESVRPNTLTPPYQIFCVVRERAPVGRASAIKSRIRSGVSGIGVTQICRGVPKALTRCCRGLPPAITVLGKTRAHHRPLVAA